MGWLERWFGKGSKWKLEEILAANDDFMTTVERLDGFLVLYGPGKTRRDHDAIKDNLVEKALAHFDANPADRILDRYAVSDLISIVTSHEIAEGVAMNIAPSLYETALMYGQDTTNGYGTKISWIYKDYDLKKKAVSDFLTGVDKLRSMSGHTDVGGWDVMKAAKHYFNYMLMDIEDTMSREKEDYDKKKELMTLRRKDYARVDVCIKYKRLLDLANDYKNSAESKGFIFDAKIIGKLGEFGKKIDGFLDDVRGKAPEILGYCVHDAIAELEKSRDVKEIYKKVAFVRSIIDCFRLPEPGEMKMLDQKLREEFNIYT
jgi:hypothetical protein